MSVEREKKGNGMKTMCACDSRLIGWLIYALFAFAFDTNSKQIHSENTDIQSTHTHTHGQLSIIFNSHQCTVRAVYTQSHSTHAYTHTNAWKCIVRYSRIHNE